MRLRNIVLAVAVVAGAAAIASQFVAPTVADTASADAAWILEPSEAASRIRDKDPTILDTRPTSEWKEGHLPGAVRLDWEAFTPDETSERGTLLEDDAELQSKLRALGISEEKPVVVVGADDGGWGESGRAVWMLRTLGHDAAAWVDGGHRAVVAEGIETTTDEPDPERGDISVDRRETWSISGDRLRQIYDRDDVVLLDTREPREYRGETPYGETRGGHIPGAKHLYFKSLLRDNGRLLPSTKIRSKLQSIGVDRSDTVVTYCTGGVRSAWVASVLVELGYHDVQNYAGSTWQWAARSPEKFPLESD